MERTTKIKIALGVLLVLLLARWILGFFPVPLEFAPYTGKGEAGLLQTVTFTEIKHVMTVVPEDGKTTYYYFVTYNRDEIGLVCSTTKYIDEVFGTEVIVPETTGIPVTVDKTVTFTGMLVDLPDTDTVTAENKEYFYSQITFTDAYLAEYGGDEEAAYRSICKQMVLNRDFEAQETPNLAATIVAVLAFFAFCVMMAMLLKEYAGGKRERKSRSEERR